jgi:hypothetical protein
MYSTTQASSIKAGDRIARYGYQWLVVSVTFDPLGNTGNAPRYIFDCEVIDAPSELPSGYHRIHMGCAPDAPVALI